MIVIVQYPVLLNNTGLQQAVKTIVPLFVCLLLLSGNCIARPAGIIQNQGQRTITISNKTITLVLDYNNKISITSMTVNGENVINVADGIYTGVQVAGVSLTSLHVNSVPRIAKDDHTLTISGIRYGNKDVTITEKWIFFIKEQSIKWDIERDFSRQAMLEEGDAPVFNFNNINTWEGAYQGYGGLAWFYLFNEKLCTYGVHTQCTSFWNSKNGNGLHITVDAPGKKVAMKYTRTASDKLLYGITVSDKEMLPRLDSGTNRRRFINNRADVWAPFTIAMGKSHQSITLSYFNFNEAYGHGHLKGIDSSRVSAVLNTIARIGVIDSLHFGANSWHTPFGPICLHEQYVAQLGLAINDPNYLKGYQSCLDYFMAHAIQPGGRVYARWAYTNEDRMADKGNKEGFYEAQWGILMDSNPDLVSNVAELYDLTGNKNWVSAHRQSCEKVLDWILKRDSNGNGLVEMMSDSHEQKMGSDWIDIIWASYENAFVNAKLYHALIKWAAIEHQLNNDRKAAYYESFATRLKTSFNRSTKEGGFWDEEKKCYVHWIDKDKTVHGRNMVTPVNFMAIAYGICDNDERRKIILDTIEAQMQHENLFFWPLAMTSYAPGEGKEFQFPFPSYENGDIFLSWGAVAIKAYAAYDPAVAVKYVKNVLNQYGKDGLAFQRYGRLKQEGLGDDILSGNSLAIAGLYEWVYGINPMFNRFYLDPHITPELSGTSIPYRFRNKRLTIDLAYGNYTVSDKMFTLSSNKDFGFNTTKNQLSYFDGNNPRSGLQVTSSTPLIVAMQEWSADKMIWIQTVAAVSQKLLTYAVHQLKPNTDYAFCINEKPVKKIRSNGKGDAVINYKAAAIAERIMIRSSHVDG